MVGCQNMKTKSDFNSFRAGKQTRVRCQTEQKLGNKDWPQYTNNYYNEEKPNNGNDMKEQTNNTTITLNETTFVCINGEWVGNYPVCSKQGTLSILQFKNAI